MTNTYRPSKTEYRVICLKDVNFFNERVNVWLTEGWSLRGQMQYVNMSEEKGRFTQVLERTVYVDQQSTPNSNK